MPISQKELKQMSAKASSDVQDTQDYTAMERGIWELGWEHGFREGEHLGTSSIRQIEDAHHALDMMGVSRETPGGEKLTVRGRIDVLRGI